MVLPCQSCRLDPEPVLRLVGGRDVEAGVAPCPVSLGDCPLKRLVWGLLGPSTFVGAPFGTRIHDERGDCIEVFALRLRRMKPSGSSAPYRVIVCLGIAYVLLRPVAFGEVLYPTLALLGLSGLGALLFARQRASTEIVGVLGMVLAIGLWGTAIGANNPGVWQHAAVWIVAPLVYGFWVLGADEGLLRPLFAAIAWATISLSAVILVYAATQLGVIADVVPTWLTDAMGAGFGIEEGSTAIRLYGLSTLVAAAPMWVTACLVGDHPVLPARATRILAAVLASVASLLGGRNAIVLVLLVVPVLVVLIRAFIRRDRNMRLSPVAFFGIVSGVLAAPLVVTWTAENAAVQRTWNNIVSFFAGTGQSERVEQVAQLLEGWLQSPFFGHGLGATIPGYWRSDDRPWNFEMQYHMLLFQFGVLGCTLILAMVAFAIRAVVRAAEARPDLTPVMVVAITPAIAMLIANATNPYLQAPGHMWAIFLPLLVANVALVNPQTTGHSEGVVTRRAVDRRATAM